MAGRRFIRAPNAIEVVRELAKPARVEAAAAIAAEIPAHVPIVHGGAIQTYKPTVVESGDVVAVDPGSPLWHLLEYGTAQSAAYRPIENAVRAVGLDYEAK